MEANTRTASDIFNGSRTLTIPFFQRAYVWEEDQWERFLEDMQFISQENVSYFLGSVILKYNPTPTTNQGERRTVIDGQQRLTTLIIFCKVLCLKLGKDDLFKKRFIEGQSEKIALRHSHNDLISFERIVQLLKIEEIDDEDSQKDNIIKSYNFFKKHIELDNFKGEGKNKFYTVVNNIQFIVIDLASGEDEQKIFDTINSLGVRLTAADLLKNYLFEEKEIDLYNEHWKKIFEANKVDKNYWDADFTIGRAYRSLIDLFFHGYLQIKLQSTPKLSAEEKKKYTKQENIFEGYKFLIDKKHLDKNIVIGEISEYAKIFRENLNIERAEESLSDKGIRERLNVIIFKLEATTLIPYVLFILRNVKNQQQQEELFNILESYIMRRLIVRATNKGYNYFFSQTLIGKNVISVNDFQKIVCADEEGANCFPDDEMVEDAFYNAKLTNNNAKGILYFLESKISNETQVKGIQEYTLEHLMPKKWKDNWERPQTEEENNDRDKKLLTLGNLAIVSGSLNSSLKNDSWEKKRKKLEEKASGIKTTFGTLTQEIWNEASIEARAKYLLEKALETWKNIN